MKYPYQKGISSCPHPMKKNESSSLFVTFSRIIGFSFLKRSFDKGDEMYKEFKLSVSRCVLDILLVCLCVRIKSTLISPQFSTTDIM